MVDRVFKNASVYVDNSMSLFSATALLVVGNLQAAVSSEYFVQKRPGASEEGENQHQRASAPSWSSTPFVKAFLCTRERQMWPMTAEGGRATLNIQLNQLHTTLAQWSSGSSSLSLLSLFYIEMAQSRQCAMCTRWCSYGLRPLLDELFIRFNKEWFTD